MLATYIVIQNNLMNKKMGVFVQRLRMIDFCLLSRRQERDALGNPPAAFSKKKTSN